MIDRVLPTPLKTVTLRFVGGDRLTGELDRDSDGNPTFTSDAFGTVPILRPELITAWDNDPRG